MVSKEYLGLSVHKEDVVLESALCKPQNMSMLDDICLACEITLRKLTCFSQLSAFFIPSFNLKEFFFL